MHTGSRKLNVLDTLYGVWFGTVFACCALTTVVMVTVVPGALRRRRAVRRAAKAAFWLAGASPQVQGVQHLPAIPAVAVANHASYLDGLLLTAVLPEQYQFVIKREVTQVPIVHFVLRRVGAHFVDRDNTGRSTADLRRIYRTAGQGGSLAFFPEGTFRAEPGLRRFRNGAFALAQRGALPLVPIAIRGTRHMLPAQRLLPIHSRLDVVIHPPVETMASDDAQAAVNACRQAILSSLSEPDLMAP